MRVYLVWEKQGLLGLTVLLKIFKSKDDADTFISNREVKKYTSCKIEVRSVI